MAPPKHILLVLLAFLLILPACQNMGKKETSAKTPACNWPPDTMMIKIQGSGHIAVRFLWRDPIKRASPCPDESFVLPIAQSTSGSTPQFIMRESHTPQDTTPAGKVALVLGGPPSSTDGTDLLLVKWPPDTTTGGGN